MSILRFFARFFLTPITNLPLELDFEQSERVRKTRLFQILCLIWIGLDITAAGVSTVLVITTGQAIFWAGTIISIVMATIIGFSSKLICIKHFSTAAWLLICSVTMFAFWNFWLMDTKIPMLMLVMYPVAIAIVLMNMQQVLLVTGLNIALAISWYVEHDILKVYNSPTQLSAETQFGLTIIIVTIGIATIVALLYIPTHNQIQTMRTQNDRLQQALAEVEVRQYAGQSVSQQVLALAAQLNSTAKQQATGSQEQVSLVKQVNTSITELSTTANQIADQASQVDQVANRVGDDSQQIEQTSTEVVRQSKQGLAAVQHTISVSSEVARLYQNLMETMNELNDKSARMRVILNLLGSIASETRLLALNAAIEAAGAGEYGERFGVVAQHIKGLANRSADASQEVVNIIQEIEEAFRQTVEAAEGGYSKANKMEEVANQTGRMIEQMRGIAERSQNQAVSINKTMKDVKQLSEIIKTATAQQRSASQQVLEALGELSLVAKQSAEGSTLVSSTAFNLEQVSENLTQALVA
jgi:methyl-accepting chemotaxis protein